MQIRHMTEALEQCLAFFKGKSADSLERLANACAHALQIDPRKYEEEVLSTWETWNKILIKDKIYQIRYSQIISDPFPEHTQYQSTVSSLSKLGQFFDFTPTTPKPDEVSIWKAYQMGYDKAYAEIVAAIGDKEIK